ncbi:MAG: nuclear transport factor 2 family protein [bacterium]|nr:nuclear transport factor 2 family protein [bacterium]
MKILVMSTFIFALAAVASAQVNKDLEDLADAERAFAAETVRVGFRDGFIKYFADDGIGFGPEPQRTREVLLRSPAPTGPRKVIFNWAPMFGDISAAGDLGYTTGPVLYTDTGDNPRPPRHGMYFSVWQKQADGSWKVAIDMGVNTPSAVGPIDTKFVSAGKVGPFRKIDAPDYRKLDGELKSWIVKTGPVKAYGALLDSEFRIHRAGVMPITDRKDLAAVVRPSKFEFIGGKIASSNDLAFTYGKYATVNVPDAETGYYVHVWQRNESGEWKLVADIQNASPK